MRIEGGFVVAAPQARVFEKITDPHLMADCVPGCESVEVLGPTSYRAKIKISVGPISARFNLVVDVTREEPPAAVFLSTKGEEGSRASMVSAQSEVRFADVGGDSTEVTYASEVSVTGRLGKFGLGIMKKKAEVLAAEFAAAFSARLAAEGVS